MRFSVKNTTTEKIALEIAHAFLPTTDLFFRNKAGSWQKIEAGYLIPADKKNIKHHFQVFHLPEGNIEFYVRLLSNSHPLPIKIWKQSNYEIKTYQQRLVYGFYVGFMIFVIITNVFFFFSLRNWLYLFYAFVVLIYIAYAAMVMDGFILYFFPKVDLMFWYITIPTLGVTVQTVYALLFLEAKKYIPKWNKIIWGVVIYFALYFFLKYLMPLTVILAFNTVHALISFFIMGFVGIKVGKKGNPLGYYFALAYLVYFILVLVEATYIQTGSPSYFNGLSHVAYATLFEAFILSFLLSKRFEWEKEKLEKEKLEAQEEILEKTIENERIVREQNVILEKEVAKRTESLKTSNQKLVVANATKEKFFSIISHDFKSPFNSIIGFSQLLHDEYEVFNEEDKKMYIGYINNTSKNAFKLLENLLSWSAAQTGVINFSPKKENLRELLASSIAILEESAINKSISLKLNVADDIFISADKNMLSTVVRNLVSNSIKFTQKKGEITLMAEKTNRNENVLVQVTIKDNGVGIAPEVQSKLFNIAENVSTKGTDKEKGTGLGLILCKEFIERHKGEIWVESEEGKGSMFRFTIPI